MSKEHKCPRCGYTSVIISNFKKHLQRLTICEPYIEDISLDEIRLKYFKVKIITDICENCNKSFSSKSTFYAHKKECTKKETILQELKEEINELKKKQTSTSIITNELKMQVMFLKNKKKEDYYQIILEQYLQNTHKKVECGITDVTTVSCHAEIKRWDCWKEALGQLISYNTVDPKDNIQAYMFGKYGTVAKNTAINVFQKNGIKVFDFIENENVINILDIETKKCVYTIPKIFIEKTTFSDKIP